MTSFDQTGADPQATPAEALAPSRFDFEAYEDYEALLLQRCADFWQSDSGVLVYRRMRVAEVFSFGCRDAQSSLEWQLGALRKSMQYKADVPNFLEPWYGIGTIAGAYGVDYVWSAGQAPAVKPPFASVNAALAAEAIPVADSPIGRRTLDMIDLFLERTGGRLPMSLTDTQSPLNVAGNVVDMTGLFTEMFDDPDAVRQLLGRLGGLLSEFVREQAERIDERLVWPGHGFASGRCFDALGMSDDNVLMISDQQYLDFAVPVVQAVCAPFGGYAFHSCGDWLDRIEMVKQIPGLRVVDAAFSAQTDPTPNPAQPFGAAFANTGVVVNARIVGDAQTIVDIVGRLWAPGLKLIVVTYCQSPDEQAAVYDHVHGICS